MNDGIHWTKDPAPVLRATRKVADWDGFLGEPGAVVYDDKLYLYFSAFGARPGASPPQLQSIGLAISADGRTFDKPRCCCGSRRAGRSARAGRAHRRQRGQGLVSAATPDGKLGDLLKRGFRGREFGIGLMKRDLASFRETENAAPTR